MDPIPYSDVYHADVYLHPTGGQTQVFHQGTALFPSMMQD